MILNKRSIGRMRLRRPIFFYVLSDGKTVTLVNDRYPSLRVSGANIEDALEKLDRLILSLIYLYEGKTIATELKVATFLLEGITKTWGGLDVQGVRPIDERS